MDTAGQEEYSSLSDSYIKYAEGLLVVYSVTSRESFEKTMTLWNRVEQMKNGEEVQSNLNV